MTVNKGGGGGANYSEGWKTLTISRAAYGVFNDAKYLDVWFEGYPENFNARIYSKVSNGEEWAMGQVFRFANAGITGGLEGADGKMVIKMDDNPINLAGKEVNVYIYKDGKYGRILKQFAPIAFKNVAETFSDEDVVYWKGRAEKYFTDYVKPKLSEAGEADSSFVSSTATTETNTTSVATGDDMPF
tara:strand:- start:4607 stop:5167 length:561 start_codon:yes stop_codon:yes gene_type:complete